MRGCFKRPLKGPPADRIARLKPSPGARKGAALVLVLLLLAVITVLVTEFLFNLRIHTALFHNHEARLEGKYVARAGMNAADSILSKGNTYPENTQLWNNELMSFYRYKCLGGGMAGLGMLSPSGLPDADEAKDAGPDADVPDQAEMQGCGEWSLAIPYQLGETSLDMAIYDEQARINLNALMIKVEARDGAQAQLPSYRPNHLLMNILYELFVFQIVKNNIELAAPPDEIVLDIIDYFDCCLQNGAFDTDRRTYFDYGDEVIPMKNGPFDTVEEIRVVPGMNDELFDAVKDFLTVYPVKGQVFLDRINLNTAPVEILYAVIRGCSYSEGYFEGGQPEISQQDALDIANKMVSDAFAGGAQAQDRDAGKQLSLYAATTAGALPRYGRPMPPELAKYRGVQKNWRRISLQDYRSGPRFYRIVSTAFSEDAIEMTITRVVRSTRAGPVTVLYYKEK